ncbi:cleft lip and palate transmembrane protein 1-domain-containing protein [Dipodascopsis tothii]|uniref:cleft lip and palate transmembrane protein 1-domain-containing protein n=1 Tax=Dipodascopsis tothii TaxID=44089 RepID=UPI0034CEB7BD
MNGPSAAAVAHDGPRPEERRNRLSFRNMVLLFFGLQFVIGQITSRNASKHAPIPHSDTNLVAEDRTAVEFSLLPEQVFPLWPSGTRFDLRMYFNDKPAFTQFSKQPSIQRLDLELGDRYLYISETLSIPTTRSIRNNGTLYAHIFVAKAGLPFNPQIAGYSSLDAYDVHILLNQFLPEKKIIRTKHLLGGNDDELADEQDVGDKRIISYWHPNVTLELINPSILGYSASPPQIRREVPLEKTGLRDETGKNGWFYPLVFHNKFWQLQNQMTAIDSTTINLPITLEIKTAGLWKFQLMASLDEGFRQQSQAMGGSPEIEEIKRVLTETNIYLLATTAFVTMLHTLFEFLAFKNDISHWRTKNDNVGVSVRTIIANVVMQTIIFLYLMDNNDGTSVMVMLGQGFGILVEAWKITKSLDIRLVRKQASFPGYGLLITDKHVLSETEKKTQKYDQIAFRYLYIVAVPLLLAYAVYSLIYETHKSWYSFIITSLVGSVYAYGFLMLVPSIYINYRLKSVAHMPRRTMVYKFLNTFIDDFFAFVIKMPLLHRLATLRDDVIFFIYLYQTWLYRIDYTRINEFGQGGKDEDDEESTRSDKNGIHEISDAPVTVSSSTRTSETKSQRRTKKT